MKNQNITKIQDNLTTLDRRTGMGWSEDDWMEHAENCSDLEMAKELAEHGLMESGFELSKDDAEKFGDACVELFKGSRGWIGYRYNESDDILATLSADSDDIDPSIGEYEGKWSVYQDNRGGENGNEPTESETIAGPFDTEAEAQKARDEAEAEILADIRARALGLIKIVE